MHSSDESHPSYVTIWMWLIALLGAGLMLLIVPMSKPAIAALLFGFAAVKATLVVRHYMHIRGLPMAAYAILGIPVMFVIGMIVALLPDIAFRE